jgi:hypothetical protein
MFRHACTSYDFKQFASLKMVRAAGFERFACTKRETSRPLEQLLLVVKDESSAVAARLQQFCTM